MDPKANLVGKAGLEQIQIVLHRRSRGKKRLKQAILAITFLAFSWLAMQGVHELGHVLGALLTGGRPDKVYLHPLIISATAVFPNPHPVMVLWSGPILGTLIPLGAACLAYALKWPGAYLYRFFAGFCAVMNGIYIGAGPFFPIGDTESLRAYGCPLWAMLLFGLPSLMLGLYLWNNQGPHFGLGKAKGQVDTGATITSSCLLVTLVIAELIANAW